MKHQTGDNPVTVFDEKLLNKGCDKRVFGLRLKNFIITSMAYSGSPVEKDGAFLGIKSKELYSVDSSMIVGGACMERIDEEMKLVNEAFKESKQILQDTINEVRILHDVAEVSLSKFLKNIREYRMATVRESSEILVQLKDIRKFFLEDDYDKEVVRLEKLVGLCKELKELKADGTLDAVADSIIKLSLKEKS